MPAGIKAKVSQIQAVNTFLIFLFGALILLNSRDSNVFIKVNLSKFMQILNLHVFNIGFCHKFLCALSHLFKDTETTYMKCAKYMKICFKMEERHLISTFLEIFS